MPFFHIIALMVLTCILHSFCYDLFKMHRAPQDSLGYQGKQENWGSRMILEHTVVYVQLKGTLK